MSLKLFQNDHDQPSQIWPHILSLASQLQKSRVVCPPKAGFNKEFNHGLRQRPIASPISSRSRSHLVFPYICPRSRSEWVGAKTSAHLWIFDLGLRSSKVQGLRLQHSNSHAPKVHPSQQFIFFNFSSLFAWGMDRNQGFNFVVIFYIFGDLVVDAQEEDNVNMRHSYE